MIEACARLLAKKRVAAGVVVVVVVLAALAATQARKVNQDDDLLAFLPRGNPEVAQFYDINKRFGGLDVAIVGIAVDDPFDRSFLVELRKLTKELNAERSIGYALSLSNVEDFTLDEQKGGVRAEYLVNKIPETDADKAALRARVMSKEHVVGNLIAPGGDAVIIYNFAGHDADPRAVADLVRDRVNKAFPDHAKYWGGAPFISTYIYDITQADMRRLIPWAVGVILLIVLASFRDVVGSLLALLSTGIGIVFSYGLMGARGVNANIVLSSMPVILFAVGSAYGIHILVRYYALRETHECEEALVLTLVRIGPTVAAAGLTTVAGLLSFLAMDIGPMRQFGLYTGLGILATLLLSLTFVPAVIRLVDLKSKRFDKSMFRDILVKLSASSHKHRKPLVVVLGLLVVAGAALAGRVQARMENAAFFSADSPPDRAERFLRDKFGGSQFIQILVKGDMNDPGVLRELQRIADELSVLPHVSSVNHVGQVLSMVFEAMVGERRVPPKRGQTRMLYRLLQGRSAVKQLVGGKRKQALIHVKIDTDAFEAVDKLLTQVEKTVRDGGITDYRLIGRRPVKVDSEGRAAPNSNAAPAPTPADRKLMLERRRRTVRSRLLAHLHNYGFELDQSKIDLLGKELEKPSPKADAKSVHKRVLTFLRSDESILEEEQHVLARPTADAVVSLGRGADAEALGGAITKALQQPVDEELVDDLASSLVTVLKEIWRQQASRAYTEQLLSATGIRAPEGARGQRFSKGVADALLDLSPLSALVAAKPASADGKIDYAVSGVPVLHRGLSTSVTTNQYKSLGFALALVLVIMMLLFRSVVSGLLAAAPTVLTLLVIYGIMGLVGLNLDIGTSMLASIIIGAGVDYAVHLLAAWRAEEKEDLVAAARRAAEHAGPAIWTNALMVCAGFFVLTLGQAKPLKNVGGLTAAAMITAALVTFVALPVLARKRRYIKQDYA